MALKFSNSDIGSQYGKEWGKWDKNNCLFWTFGSFNLGKQTVDRNRNHQPFGNGTESMHFIEKLKKDSNCVL